VLLKKILKLRLFSANHQGCEEANVPAAGAWGTHSGGGEKKIKNVPKRRSKKAQKKKYLDIPCKATKQPYYTATAWGGQNTQKTLNNGDSPTKAIWRVIGCD